MSCSSLNQAPTLTTTNNDNAIKVTPISVTTTTNLDDDVYSSVYKSAIDSVVTINTISSVSSSSSGKRYFVPVPVTGSASGFVINDKGYIITNYHVVSGVEKLEVFLPNDKKSYNATFVDGDESNDIAIIKIETTKELKPLPLGNSDELEVGKKVMAIGNPFGLDGTLTTGIVSYLNRNLTNEEGTELKNLIQTDTAMNPGNSGGPLLNSKGEVVGINTAIFSTTGGNIGIGFSIPVNKIKEVLKKLSLA